MKFLIKIILIFPIALSLYAGNVEQSEIYQSFGSANKYFHEKNYNKAIELYKEIYKKGIHNGYIFYNIGTSYIKKHELGKSLYWYNKAKFFIPLNSSLNKNIQIAISRNQDSIPDKTFFKYLESIFILGKIFSMKINYYITTGLFLVLILFLIIKNFVINLKKKYILNRAIIFSLVLFVIFSINLIFEYYEYNFLNTGYIIANNTSVKDDYNIDANTIATVNDGTKVFILSGNDKFYKIKLLNKLEGWVLKSKVINKGNE